MNNIVYVALIALIHASAIRAADIAPADSGKDIEVRIASLLKQKLKVATELKVTDETGDDVQVVTVFRAEENRQQPKIAVFIDTKILSRDKEQVQSQAIRIFSAAEIEISGNDRLKLLEWANAWNDNALPMRAQIVGGSVIIAFNIVTTRANPVAEDSVLAGYLSVAKAWPTVLDSLRKNKLLE